MRSNDLFGFKLFGRDRNELEDNCLDAAYLLESESRCFKFPHNCLVEVVNHLHALSVSGACTVSTRRIC